MRNKANPLDDFLYLWKTEDKEWMAERKQQWKALKEGNLKGVSQRELSQYRKYFLSGEKDAWIEPIFLFLFSPFDSAETTKKFYDSGIVWGEDRRRVYSDFLLDPSINFEARQK